MARSTFCLPPALKCMFERFFYRRYGAHRHHHTEIAGDPRGWEESATRDLRRTINDEYRAQEKNEKSEKKKVENTSSDQVT